MFFALLASSVLLSIMAYAQPRVLVYTATTGYRHDSIPTAIRILGEEQSSWNITFEFTEDRDMFRDETLKRFDGLMFVSTTGEILDDQGKEAFHTFIRSGGVFAGVHSASDSLVNDTEYVETIGALFDYHPPLQSATFLPLTKDHPATAELPDRWTFEEEVYYFKSDPRDVGAVVLLTVDEQSYSQQGASGTADPAAEGSPHPIAWYIETPRSSEPLVDGAPKAGRSFYTSLGHLNSTWEDQTFITHVMSGLKWALDGASTRSYGIGLVGETSNDNNNSSSSTGGGSSSSSAASASNTGSVSASVSVTQSGASVSGASGVSAAASTGAAGTSRSLPEGVVGAGAVAVGAIAAGMAIVL